jgi:hypothetical protein
VGFDSAKLIYPHVAGVVSWAGPLAGNHDFAEFVIQKYQGKVFRMVHSSDIVTKVGRPPPAKCPVSTSDVDCIPMFRLPEEWVLRRLPS